MSRTRAGGDAGVGEVLSRVLLVLVLGVDRRELCAGRGLQHPQARDADARADLDDRTGSGGRGDDRELRADRRRDRFDAELERLLAGLRDGLGLDDGLVDVLPVQVVIGHVFGSRDESLESPA